MALTGLFAPLIATHNPVSTRLELNLTPIGQRGYLLGSDELGRDIFSRLVYGAQISIFIGIVIVAIGGIIGTLMGAVAGYYDRLDGPVMRLVDLMLSMPGILLSLAIVAALGPGLMNALLAVGISTIPVFARFVRSVVLTIRNFDFVMSARALGQPEIVILLRHVLPNCMGPIIVQMVFRMGTGILTAAALSFIGLGAQPPTPEWGAMLSNGRIYALDAPHLAFLPGLAIMILVLGFNFFGNGLRDALDPRLLKE